MTDQTAKTPVRRALISVSDKAGVVEFARALHTLKVEILSTGGTYKLLCDNGIPAVEVADYTGFAEMMDGRVKTTCTRKFTAASSADALLMRQSWTSKASSRSTWWQSTSIPLPLQ